MTDETRRELVFICEDSQAGKAFLTECVHHCRPGARVWSGQGVDNMPRLARLARSRFPDAKIALLPDGDKLDRPPARRRRLRDALTAAGAMVIVVRGNVEALARSCLRPPRRDDYERRLRSLGKEAALRWVLDHRLVAWEIARSQPELEDMATVARCGSPTRCPL